MLGKTFKGLTDAMLAWQTEELLALEERREGHVVYVRPELVVEIAFDGVQTSPRYPGGVALRFARVRAPPAGQAGGGGGHDRGGARGPRLEDLRQHQREEREADDDHGDARHARARPPLVRAAPRRDPPWQRSDLNRRARVGEIGPRGFERLLTRPTASACARPT